MEQNTNITTSSIDNPQVLFSWRAPARAYKQKSNGVLRFYFALALLLSVVVALFGDWILILPIFASVFLYYALTITPPGDIDYKITRFGIETHGTAYRFQDLAGFFITKKFDYFVITIQSNSPFFNHVYLIIDDQKNLQKIVDILSEHLVFVEKPQRTFSDRMALALSSIVPDEEPTAKPPKQT